MLPQSKHHVVCETLQEMKPWARSAARLRVSSGFAVAAAYLIYARPRPVALAAGLLLGGLGLALRAWAAGHLAKNLSLATSGPFAFTRNPLYLGSLLVAAGFAVAGRSWALAALLAVYFLMVYVPVIGEEESHLRALFPDYQVYAARVPRLWPRWRPAGPGGGSFRWALYLRNREYQAALGYLAAAAVLAIKLAFI